MSSLKSPGVQPSALRVETTSISRDTVAVRDHRDEKREDITVGLLHLQC